jgi:hypothetical protein
MNARSEKGLVQCLGLKEEPWCSIEPQGVVEESAVVYAKLALDLANVQQVPPERGDQWLDHQRLGVRLASSSRRVLQSLGRREGSVKRRFKRCHSGAPDAGVLV